MSIQWKIGELHCEKTGVNVSLANTEILTKINGILSINKLTNLNIDLKERVIHSDKGSIRYFSMIDIPDDLKGTFGQLYGLVDDEDDLEQSTALLSKRGKEIFMGNQLVRFEKYLKEYELIKVPENIEFIISNSPSHFKTKLERCETCNMNFVSIGKKYMSRKILGFKKQVMKWGYQSVILPGYDVAIGDCSDKNTVGTGYLFSTDQVFKPVKLCSNECAVKYCLNHYSIISYIDFANKAKLRVLSEFTISINTNLQNDYKFRSSNI